MARKHYYHTHIKEIYLDTFGHMNNATYLALLEEARWDLLNQNGYGLVKIQQTQLGPTILQINIQFMRELCVLDNITIETELISYDKKIGKLQQRVLRGEEVCCIAEFTIALFDLRARKLVLPTNEWLQAVGVTV